MRKCKNGNRSSRNWALLALVVSMGCAEDREPTPEGSLDVTADTYAVTSDHRLIYFERSTGKIRTASAITGLPQGAGIIGVDFRPADGALYVVADNGLLYTMDVGSGAVTLKSTLAADASDTTSPFSALAGTAYGVNFNPVADRLRVVSNTGQNLRINVDTGATTTDGALNPGTPAANAAAYSNSFAAACRTRLYVLDTSTNKLLLQDPPNAGTLTEIGPLGTAAASAAWAGLEVISRSDGTTQAIALLPVTGGTTVYDLDLATGTMSNARSLALHAGEALRGVSALPPTTPPPQAPGDLLGVTVSNQVVSFNRGAPGKLCTKAAITGIAAGEDVLGVDVRPADGALYALGSSGQVYTLDVVTGVATSRSTLAADPADLSEPFTSLPASDFGVGFNPVPDRLRVVSRSGQNLRINVDTGVTISDAALSPGSMAVTALGYENAFAGATSTTLFAIDTESKALIRIGAAPATGGACPLDVGNPNCGITTSVGLLGVTDLSGVDGLDLDGDPAASVSAFAAIRIGSATSSSLYVIDLVTGVATPPVGVANPTIGGGEALRELTLAANPVVPAAP